jgi:hypothetical protein
LKNKNKTTGMRILPIRNENPVKITTVLRNGRRANDGISIV